MTDSVRHHSDSVAPQGPGAAASLLEPALAAVAGADAFPVSLTLDYGRAIAAGESVTVEAWIDRATRTLVFAYGRVLRRADGALLASGAALFRRAASA